MKFILAVTAILSSFLLYAQVDTLNAADSLSMIDISRCAPANGITGDTAKSDSSKTVVFIWDNERYSVNCASYVSADTIHYPDNHSPVHFTGEGYWILYKNGHISHKGYFHKKELVCGIEFIYRKNGSLRFLKLHEEGERTRKVKVRTPK